MDAAAGFSEDSTAIVRNIAPALSGYRFDHYRHYPAANPRGWEDFFLHRLAATEADPEAHLIWSEADGGRCLLAVRIRAWDERQFGFPTGSIEILYQDGDSAVRDCADRADALLRERDCAFVSTRVHGDQLDALHVLEDQGFRYYENIIWPTVRCDKADPDYAQYGVREMREEDVDAVVEIAERNQFSRNHFYCDPGFDSKVIDAFYGTWLRGVWQRRQPTIVIEDEGRVAGYFVLELPEPMSRFLGQPYGGMRSLGLSSQSRGKGLGIRIFKGAIAYLKSRGATVIDSGYASKNHVSARLHVQTGFYSAYEEITLHRWLRRAP